jgi:glycine cleavage system H protein
MQVEDRHEIGEIESSKAVSSLFTPFAGRIIDFNETVLVDPSSINTDNYGAGWLFDMETDSSLLTPQQYVELLDEGWEKTQRAIKGQMN